MHRRALLTAAIGAAASPAMPAAGANDIDKLTITITAEDMRVAFQCVTKAAMKQMSEELAAHNRQVARMVAAFRRGGAEIEFEDGAGI